MGGAWPTQRKGLSLSKVAPSDQGSAVASPAPDIVNHMQAIDSESWDFALKLYAQPGIAASCLQLQAECGVDVMMLLMVTFAAVRRGVVLKPSDIEEMDAVCRSWREQIVLPLRALRTTLKVGPAPAPGEGTEKLRTSIKGAELMAERMQNTTLAHWLAQRPRTTRAAERAEIIAALHALVGVVSQSSGDSPIDALLASIVDTAIELSA
jgi:uncharacterized protein (TIGR02444 family)